MQAAMHELRILIADDHEIVRRGVKDLLESRSGWLICAEASTGRQAVALADQHKPDIVVLDIGLPELNGIEAARIICKTLPKTEVLIFSVYDSEQILMKIRAAGARAYVNKLDANRDLVLAVEALANHRSFFTFRAQELLWHEALTAREREVIQLIVEEKRTKEIAAILGISIKTAETHRANIMRKLDIHSVSGLVHYAVRNQIIEP